MSRAPAIGRASRTAASAGPELTREDFAAALARDEAMLARAAKIRALIADGMTPEAATAEVDGAASAGAFGASAQREPREIHGQPFHGRSVARVGEADLEHDRDSFPPVTPRADKPVTADDLKGQGLGRSFEYGLRDELRPLARGRVRGCGRIKVKNAAWVKGQGEDVEVWRGGGRSAAAKAADAAGKANEKRCYYRNQLTCGSAWECPVCMGRHRRAGAEKVKLAVERWEKGYDGKPLNVEPHGAGSVLMLSLTVRHGLGNDLGVVRRGVTTAFSRMLGGRKNPWCGDFCSNASLSFFDDLQAHVNAGGVFVDDNRMPVNGFVRALEVTHGKHGWHPHIHALLFCTIPPSEKTIALMRQAISDRWSKCVRAVLGEEHVPLDTSADGKHPGCDLRACKDAAYLSKMGLELSASWTKQGRKAGQRAPLQIAVDYATTHDASDGKLWQTYCAGMKGARMLTWSGGFAAKLGLTDEDEMEKEEGEDDKLVASIDDVTWHRVRDIRRAKLAILEGAERSGADGVRETIAHILAHGKAPPPPPRAQAPPPPPRSRSPVGGSALC